MVRICVLSSGSGGNMIYIEGSRGSLVIDCGIPVREAFRRFDLVGIQPDGVVGILVTHEHSDHSRSVAPLSRRLRVPVVASQGTAAYLRAQPSRMYALQTFRPGYAFALGPFLIEPFPIPHDAMEPVGYVIWDRNVKLAVVTDLGYIPMNVQNHIDGAEILVLESNHDVQMLLRGSYPPWLKQRILSRHGHLSNADVAEYARTRLGTWCRFLFLAHLSKENNRPELAYMTVMEALSDRRNDETQVVLTSQDTPSRVITLD